MLTDPSGSSQNTFVDGLGECEKFFGFGATVGGADLVCWRRGRGLGSGFFVTKSLLVSLQLPSATCCCCCSNACILALSVAMSSPSSSPSSLSDWLFPLLLLRRAGKPQSSVLKASRSSWRYFPWLTSLLALLAPWRAASVAKPSSRSFTNVWTLTSLLTGGALSLERGRGLGRSNGACEEEGTGVTSTARKD